MCLLKYCEDHPVLSGKCAYEILVSDLDKIVSANCETFFLFLRRGFAVLRCGNGTNIVFLEGVPGPDKEGHSPHLYLGCTVCEVSLALT